MALFSRFRRKKSPYAALTDEEQLLRLVVVAEALAVDVLRQPIGRAHRNRRVVAGAEEELELEGDGDQEGQPDRHVRP